MMIEVGKKYKIFYKTNERIWHVIAIVEDQYVCRREHSSGWMYTVHSPEYFTNLLEEYISCVGDVEPL